jgi:hypothetical protein
MSSLASIAPIGRALRAAGLLTFAASAVACSSDVDVGSFGGGGSGPETSAGGEGGAPTTAASTTAASSGGGEGGSDASGSSGGQGGAGGPSTSTGEAGATGAGGEGGAGGASTCGGIANVSCGVDEYCDYVEGDGGCGIDDGLGVCAPRPTSCDAGGPASCGCDGEVYINECFARLAGTDASTLEPTCGAPCGGLQGGACADDELCDFPGDTCGVSDEQGVCVKRPTLEQCAGFADGFAPVCACDGQTYGNVCDAAAAGVDVWSGEDLCDP